MSLLLNLVAACAFVACAARADTLPYTTRTHGYSGWNTTVSGDVRTVGMAGATVGLPDTFLSATDNPAGLAMLLQDADDNLVGNSISDSHVQNYAYPITTSSLGVAFNAYPWGLSAGYVTTSREGQPYTVPTLTDPSLVDITSREFKLALARVFWRNRISLGASLNIGQADEGIDPIIDEHDSTLGATFGAMIRFPRHWLLGISYVMPMSYVFATSPRLRPTPPITGFYEPITSPARIGLGAGWVPNRFTRMSLSLYVVGKTPGAALLESDQIAVGSSLTVQPRLGAAYIFMDYKEVQGTVFAGTYLEMTRIDNTGDRLHGTAGIEIHPWVFTIGAGADLSNGYSNYLAGVGFDIFKALSKLEIIPTPYSPPRRGLIPGPLHLQDEGLPRPLVKKWKNRGPDLNPIHVIKEVPARAEKKYLEVKKMILEPENPPEDEEDSGD